MRKCGACTLCCVIPAIDELGKPVDVPCKHLTAHGCSIYEERPQVCRDFECNWKLGTAGDQTLRPDRIGAYLTPLEPGDGLGSRGLMVRARKDQPRRFERYAGVLRLIAGEVYSGGDVLVAAGESRRLLTRNARHHAIARERGIKDQDGRPVTIEEPA